jgi:CheY-like chemotaxis protein
MSDKIYRILIVDDDKDILANLSDILTDLGYETDTAVCGEDAIGKVEQFCPNQTECRYDLCLLDFKMPGIDGVELYEKILEYNPKLRAIMVTAYAGDDGVQRAIDAGTWQVLRKPVDISQLLSTIAEAIN